MRMSPRPVYASATLTVDNIGKQFVSPCPRCGIERECRRDRSEGSVCRDCRSVLNGEARLQVTLNKMTPRQLKAWMEEDS